MQWLSSLDLGELGTLPSVLLIGLLLIIIFGGIGLLRRAVATAFNVAYSVAMVGAVYLSVAILSEQVPAPENWLTFFLLTICLGLMLNYEPAGAPILETIRWALLIVTVPILAYFILFELLFTETTARLEIRLAISVTALIGLFLLAIVARWLRSQLLGQTPSSILSADSQMTRGNEPTMLLANQARQPQPAMLPALVTAADAMMYAAPGANPLRPLSKGRQVVVVAQDPSGNWMRLRHNETLWVARSVLHIQGNPDYLRVLPG